MISHDDIQLARFKGRPGEMSPKARFYMFAGWLLPSRFKYVTVISVSLDTPPDTLPIILAQNLRLIATIGSYVVRRLAKKFATSSTIIPHLRSQMAPLCFL